MAIALAPQQTAKNVGLFAQASGGKQVRLRRDEFSLESGAASSFDVLNGLVTRLEQLRWQYDLTTFTLPSMVRRRAGNCLGLSCLYGALLESYGIPVGYELVVGPKGFQRHYEVQVLEELMSGRVFPFDRPLMPERALDSNRLLFCTLEHPRLVLGSDRFECTVLRKQNPSTIAGESVRPLSYEQLMGYVLGERAHQAMRSGDLELSSNLLKQTLDIDPENRSARTMRVDLCLQTFDDPGYDVACDRFMELNLCDSLFHLDRYYIVSNVLELTAGLRMNPTDMRLWFLRHVVEEQDAPTQRANFAVAAQCIARSEILNLGNFYAQYAYLLSRLFPKDAAALIQRSCDAQTNRFEHYLALALLGRRGAIPKLQSRYKPKTPFQELQLAFALSVQGDSQMLEGLKQQFSQSQLFHECVAMLKEQWQCS